MLATGLTAAEFDRMVAEGSFDCLGPKKVELLDGEICIMNPAGPIHDDFTDYLTEWSYANGAPDHHRVRVQCGIACDDNRPEPDVAWLKPGRYGKVRPQASDILLLIEIADSSLAADLKRKRRIYATGGITEYWIMDIPQRQVHVMNRPAGEDYQDYQIIQPPQPLAPTIRPEANLDLQDLFSVVD